MTAHTPGAGRNGVRWGRQSSYGHHLCGHNPSAHMKTILYARVSTREQTIAHQRTQAEQAGFRLDEVVEDDGVSGIDLKLTERPGGRRLFDLLRKGDTLVVRWVDRLGRNYRDVSDNMREFMHRGVIVKTIINSMSFDGADNSPAGQAVRDALIGFMAATAQAQAEATKEAQRVGIAHARQSSNTAYMGRKPNFNAGQLDKVQEMLSSGQPISDIARSTGVSRTAIHRIKKEPEKMRAALQRWAAH